VGIVTSAGPEPEAAAGVIELARLTVQRDVAAWPGTATFLHRETQHGRRLRLERRGGPVPLSPADRDRFTARAVLYAPVAGEIDADALRVWDERVSRGAILQGWLRESADGDVSQRALADMAEPLRDALGRLDLLVASREDLAAEPGEPLDQLTALREAFGPRPALVVTDGVDGLWLTVPATFGTDGPVHLATPWRVEDVATVGAGDVLAAFLTMDARDPAGGWRAHVEGAMRVVAEVLEERRGPA
jgi:sugar/nucleoside kinase (ribokinase family)